MQKYILVFFITGAIFAAAFYVENKLDQKRIAEIQAAEQNISINILSSETQYELLGNLSCKIISENPILSTELNSLASQLSVAENNLGSNNSQVIQLKEQYSILEIKDYLLLQQIATKCKTKPVFILYFYSNSGDCSQCAQQGDVLSYLRNKYPGLRVYSFDYNLNLSALRTLITLNKINGPLPALIINNREPVYGFKNLDEMQALIPELKTLATTTATSTSTR